ncbi:MAG: diguanylate cyclase [Lachnospiraceae bacterium]|nr:diguanylate cyclase [Lachnospiraceae bacterium]
MREQKFVKQFRTAKIVHLGLLTGLEVIFLLSVFADKWLRLRVFSDRAVFTLCAITWLVLILAQCFLLYDFYKLRAFVQESHLLNQTAYLDRLTGIPNRYSLDELFRTYTTPESLEETGCLLFSIANLKTVNEVLGHKAGDSMIRDFCNIFEEIGDTFGFIGRNGGNEFVAVITPCSLQIVQDFRTTLENRISLYNKEHTAAPILLRSAYTLYAEEPVQTFTELLVLTYNKLYQISQS